MKRYIDLNCDLGEGAGNDRELIELCTSANVACGAHAGSEAETRRIAALARERGVRVGAHPGVPDRAGFGRRLPADLSESALADLMASLRSQCEVLSGEFAYIKPHGALYHDSANGGPTAPLIVDLLREFPVPLLGLPGTIHQTITEEARVPLIREGFADRRYTANGRLVSRTKANAVLTDEREIRDQVLHLAETVDSICVHGDHGDAIRLLTLVRRTLEDAGYRIGAGG